MVGLSEKVYKLLLKINYAVEKINEIFIPELYCCTLLRFLAISY